MVKRYRVSNGLVSNMGGDARIFDLMNLDVVLASDYDALARELAACKISRDGWTKASDEAHARIRELEKKLNVAEHDRDRWRKAFLDAGYPDVLPTRVDLEARIRDLEALLREWRDVQCDQVTPLPFMRRVDAALASQSDRGSDPNL